MASGNPFGAEGQLTAAGGEFKYYRLQKLIDDGIGNIESLPYSIRVLLESCLRNVDGFVVNESDLSQRHNSVLYSQ